MANEPTLDLEVYVDCWIAIVRGRVVVSGTSAHETLLNCRAMRLKDEPILKFIPRKKGTRRRRITAAKRK